MIMFPSEQLISALVSLLVGTLLGKEITRWLYRPRVSVKFKGISPLAARDGIHCTIKVVNIGRTEAKNCKATISIYNLIESDLVHEDEACLSEILPDYKEEGISLSNPRKQLLNPAYFRIIDGEPLPWARLGNPGSLTINPGISELLDVFKIQSDGDKLLYTILPSELGWRNLRARIKIRELSGKIMICPSNEHPTLIEFKLSFDDFFKPQFLVKKPDLLRRVRGFFFKESYYY